MRRRDTSDAPAQAALGAALELGQRDEDRGRPLLDALLDALGNAGLRAWEATMRSEG